MTSESIGETIAGFDSLHVSARISLDELPDHLNLYLKTSREKKYQTEFGWIDRIRELKYPTTVAASYKLLLKTLKAQAR